MRKRESIEYHNYRLIENELSELENSRKELIKLREEIYESTPYSEVHVQSGVGDPTSAKAAKALSSNAIYEIERRIRKIEEGLECLKARTEKPLYRLIELKYFQKVQPDDRVMELLSITGTGRSYYRLQNEAIEIIAEKLGWRV